VFWHINILFEMKVIVCDRKGSVLEQCHISPRAHTKKMWRDPSESPRTNSVKCRLVEVPRWQITVDTTSFSLPKSEIKPWALNWMSGGGNACHGQPRRVTGLPE
jgi:hypothetical protein